MKTKCPRCGEEYEVEAEALGRKAECASCGAEFQMQDAEQEAAPKIKIAVPLSNDALAGSAEKAESPEEPPSSGKKTCPFCFSEVPSGARKCAACGEWITDEKSSKKPLELCPFCQSKLAPGAKKCASCGEWIPGCKPKDPLPYIILLLLFGNLGFHDFYAEQSSRGCVKLGLFLFGLIVLCVSGEAAIFIFMLCINSFWCVVDLCSYRENLRPRNRTECAAADQADDKNMQDLERKSQE